MSNPARCAVRPDLRDPLYERLRRGHHVDHWAARPYSAPPTAAGSCGCCRHRSGASSSCGSAPTSQMTWPALRPAWPRLGLPFGPRRDQLSRRPSRSPARGSVSTSRRGLCRLRSRPPPTSARAGWTGRTPGRPDSPGRPGFARASSATRCSAAPTTAPSTAFFTEGLGFKVSDRIKGVGAFMRCSTDHHNVLVLAAPVGFLHHTSWQVDDVDDVGRGAQAMLEGRPERHVWGLAGTTRAQGASQTAYIGESSRGESSCPRN